MNTDTSVRADRLRVLVVGSSVGYYVRPPAGSGDEAAFDELLERTLRARGVDAEVRNDSRWFATIVDTNQRLPSLLTWFRPDVVVVVHGYIESQPRICPKRFAMWLFTAAPRSDAVARLVRRVLLATVGSAFYRSMARLAAIPGLPSRVPPDRLRTELGRTISSANKERRALVLCANVPHTTDRIETSLPTTGERIAATCEAIAGAVRDAGAGAELVDLRGLVRAAGTDVALPDGIHLSAAGHRLLADVLAERVLAHRPPQ